MSRALRLSIAAALGPMASVLLPAPASAQAPRPMALEDLLTAVRVSDPQLSPDGRRVLFVRTTTDPTSGERNADIWMVPADGSAPPRPFIESPKTDDSPRFLSNGRIVFVSTRDGAPQLYVADGEGRNARADHDRLGAGVQAPIVVSPDGRMVAFVSDAYPRCSDEACNARTRDSVEKDPVKVHALTRLPYRHWNEWWESVRHHVFVTDVESGATRDLTPGDYDSPPHFYEDGAIAFSPDSRQLAFVSKRGGKDAEMWTTNHDVWTVPVSGGAAKKLTPNPAADMTPVYSPDGRWIFVRAQRRAGFEADRWYLDAYDRATGAKRTLFTSPDLSVDDFKFSPDGKTIWFTAVRDGTGNLYTVPARGRHAEAGRPGRSGRRVPAGRRLRPVREIVARRTARSVSSGRRRHDASAHQRECRLAVRGRSAETREPDMAGAGGDAGAVLAPQAAALRCDEEVSSGVPHSRRAAGQLGGRLVDALESSLWAAQGWVVAAPNPRGSTGFGQKFVDEISQDWCGKAMTDLDAVFDAVSALPYVDRARAGIAGASYGGYAVDWLIGHTNRFKAAVTHDGVFNLESMALATEELWFPEWEFGGPASSATARRNFARCSPHLSADKIRTPTFVITNEQDFRVPLDQGLQLFTALRRNGVPSEGLVFQNEGHWVLSALDSKRWHESVFGWLHRYLAPVFP